jgi:hypothetical protein
LVLSSRSSSRACGIVGGSPDRASIGTNASRSRPQIHTPLGGTIQARSMAHNDPGRSRSGRSPRHCGYAELCAVRRDTAPRLSVTIPATSAIKSIMQHCCAVRLRSPLRNASPRTAGGLRPPGASPAVLGYIIHFIESCGAGVAQALARWIYGQPSRLWA